ncbi:MAG TPA: hypothetical protein VF092_03995 [Longimicrobium sp.]
MFEYLDDVDETTLTFVVYEATLLLYERERHRGPGPRFPELRGSTADPTGQITKIVHRILADIEDEERMPFTELPSELYGKYLRILSSIARDRDRLAHPPDPEIQRRAEQFLEEMRRAYPYAA